MWKTIHKRKVRGPPEFDKRFVRQSLDVLVLGLLKRQPMSGFEIIKLIHEKFDVMLSAGTVYPLLHFLKEEGLLKTVKEGKNIRYKIKNRRRANKVLNGHIEARRALEKLVS